MLFSKHRALCSMHRGKKRPMDLSLKSVDACGTLQGEFGTRWSIQSTYERKSESFGIFIPSLGLELYWNDLFANLIQALEEKL